jgi:hypothetical protein
MRTERMQLAVFALGRGSGAACAKVLQQGSLKRVALTLL